MAVHRGVMNQQKNMQDVANTAPATFYTASGNPVQIINVGAHDDRNQTNNACAARGLGITQIVLGISIFGIQIYITVLQAIGYEGSSGIWAPVVFILAGAFGIQSSVKKTKCSVVTTLVLCIIAAVLSVAVILQAPLAYLFKSLEEDNCNNGRCRTDEESFAPQTVMSLLGVTEGVIAIIAAAVCCRGCCRNSRRGVLVNQVTVPAGSEMPTTVHYTSNPTFPGEAGPLPAYKEKERI